MLPTYSSMADSAHNWQFVHSATSMIMFHFFMTLRPSRSLRRHKLSGFERTLDLSEFLVLRRHGVFLNRGEGFRHVLDAAIPQLDLHDRLTAGERVRALGLGFVRRQQIETAAAVDRLAGLAHRRVDRRRFVAVTNTARQALSRQRRTDHRA